MSSQRRIDLQEPRDAGLGGSLPTQAQMGGSYLIGSAHRANPHLITPALTPSSSPHPLLPSSPSRPPSVRPPQPTPAHANTPTHSVNSNSTPYSPAFRPRTSMAVGIESCRYPSVRVYTSTRGGTGALTGAGLAAAPVRDVIRAKAEARMAREVGRRMALGRGGIRRWREGRGDGGELYRRLVMSKPRRGSRCQYERMMKWVEDEQVGLCRRDRQVTDRRPA